MKEFTGVRFRELCDKADRSVAEARQTSSPEELSAQLSAVLPDGTELFSWDHDRRVWLMAIINNADISELIPFIKRRDCLHQLIDEHSEEFEPRYIRSFDGGVALHPAIYHAAGKAEVVGEDENVEFDREAFKAALAEWVKYNGY
ncbi:MAG TPA: hypothetical protein VN642_05820 [Dongiaceae bacterium]|nr:hypothetical protein [Dongiaceae bacterium]